MAAKFIPKVKRRSNNQPKDEFFIRDDHFVSVKKFREKIEQMYQVEVRYEKKVAEEGGQWLVLEGEPVDRRNAKNYIAALCHPNEVKQVQFPQSAWSKFDDPDALENIEKKTNAVIRPLSEIAKFEISGTELAVTLAMSRMEELIGFVVENCDDNQTITNNVPESENDFITISPSSRNASNRLSDVLNRALSEHSDGAYNAQDYSHAPDSVKRVLVNCLQDTEEFDNIDDDMLFNDGDESNPVQIEDSTHKKKEEKVKNETPEKTCVTNLTKKLTETKISKTDEVPTIVSKQVEYLQSFGLSVGYSKSEVSRAIKFVDEKTRPSDFLDLLSTIKDKCEDTISDDDIVETITISDDEDDVVILETETIEIDDNGIQSKVPSDDYQQGENTQKGNLPDGYRERLMQDFFQEDDNCSVDELKRRNAERQKLLKQRLQEQNVPKAAGKGKGKQSKKKKQTKNQGQTNQQGINNVQHDKQLRIDPGKNPYSKDDEQTCVFRVWNDSQRQSGPNSDLSTTPKRKQSNWSKDSNLTDQNQRPPSQNAWQQVGRLKQRFDGSPGRAQQWKPTGIVNPVNQIIPPQQPLFPPQDSNGDLRYIVIDGSNVAMTHGNGRCFSCKGLRICVDYFKQRGHQNITVFVPQWRTYQPSADNQIMDQNILYELKDEDILVFTPSRKIGRKLVAAYDDRFVLELAEAEDGIIVSNDQYRDLMYEKANWRRLIEERLLMFSFVGDRFMPPADPLGRDGPSLDVFLRKTKPAYQAQPRPMPWQNQYQGDQRQSYQRNKGQGQGQFQGQAQYQGQGQYQPQQGSSSMGNQGYNRPNQHSQQHHKPRMSAQLPFNPPPYQPNYDVADGNQYQHKHFGSPKGQGYGQRYLNRTDEETEELYRDLLVIFPEPDQEECVRNVLANHTTEKDITKLTNYCMSVLF